jgi:hypothetical protein
MAIWRKANLEAADGVSAFRDMVSSAPLTLPSPPSDLGRGQGEEDGNVCSSRVQMAEPTAKHNACVYAKLAGVDGPQVIQSMLPATLMRRPEIWI